MSRVNHNRVVLFDFDPLQLPENGADKLSWISRELEVEGRVPGQRETINPIELLVGRQARVSTHQSSLTVAFCICH